MAAVKLVPLQQRVYDEIVRNVKPREQQAVKQLLDALLEDVYYSGRLDANLKIQKDRGSNSSAK